MFFCHVLLEIRLREMNRVAGQAAPDVVDHLPHQQLRQGLQVPPLLLSGDAKPFSSILNIKQNV